MITIVHSYTEGTLAYGTARGDGTNVVLKQFVRWRWSPMLQLWYVQRSRRTEADRNLIEQTREALESAGYTVAVKIDDQPFTETIQAPVRRPAPPVPPQVSKPAQDTAVDKLSARPNPTMMPSTTNFVRHRMQVHVKPDEVVIDMTNGDIHAAAALIRELQGRNGGDPPKASVNEMTENVRRAVEQVFTELPGAYGDALEFLRQHPRGVNVYEYVRSRGISTKAGSTRMTRLVEKGYAERVEPGRYRVAKNPPQRGYPGGLGPREGQMWAYIRSHDSALGVRLKDMCAALGISDTLGHATLHRMVKKGFLRRTEPGRYRVVF